MSRRLQTALLLVFVAAVIVLPLWIVRYPPLLDYPDHLARSFIVSHLNDPAYRFREMYYTQWAPYPYLSMDVSLIALQHLMPIETAGRVFLSICVLGMPVAAWLFLREANPGHQWLALWTVLISYGLFFLEGFINFQLSLVVSLLALTALLRYLKAPSTRGIVLLFALFTLVYLTHLIAFAITGLIVLVYTLAEKLDWRRRLWCWAAFVPAGLLYAGSHMSVVHGGPVKFRSIPQKFFAARAALLHGYSMRLEIILSWVILACILAGYVRNPEFRWNRSWVIVFIALSVVYLALPVTAGTAWAVDIRLVPMMFVLMLTVARLGRRQKALVAVAGICASIWIANIYRNFFQLQTDLAPMHAAIEMLPQNARMLPIVDIDLSDDMPHRLYNHFWAYAIVERGALEPYIFDLPGQTEVRVREDGYVPDSPEEVPPNWLQVGRNYDYVWLWDIDYAAQLSNYATEVYHSGKLQLWRMKQDISR